MSLYDIEMIYLLILLIITFILLFMRYTHHKYQLNILKLENEKLKLENQHKLNILEVQHQHELNILEVQHQQELNLKVINTAELKQKEMSNE